MSGRVRRSRCFCEGLKRLEYRGYDSAGIALREDGQLDVRPRRRQPRQPRRRGWSRTARTPRHGLGHTRWATHGGVTEQNAHPLVGCDAGASRSSSTGSSRTTWSCATQLRPPATRSPPRPTPKSSSHLLEQEYDGDLAQALARVYPLLEGHFSIVAIHHDHPDLLVGVRHQTPLVVGVGDGENFLASSIAAFLSETRTVIHPGGRPGDRDHAAAAFASSSTARRSRRRPRRRSTGISRAPRRAASRRSCSRRSTSSPEAVQETIGDRVRGHKLVLEALGMTEDEIREPRGAS